jgi:chromatin licensing and DNA replication factor 1
MNFFYKISVIYANLYVLILKRYEMLGELFDNLDSSIRLLRMKGSMSTFSNISPKIESLTDRYC